MIESIPNHALREGHLPRRGAGWEKILPFAKTFDAYVRLGGFERVAELGSWKARNLGDWTLIELRAALFFEYRRYNHFGYDPDAAEMARIHALVEEIRARVRKGDHLHDVDT